MLKIGITGGIGSGKTTICKKIEVLGYDVFYSDEIARFLSENNQDLINEITIEFGDESYIDGKYNREYISSIVFYNDLKLQRLNEIFKSYIDIEFNKMQSEKDIIFYESALIYEHNIQNKFDFIICVYADEKIIFDRLKKRNNYTESEITNRLRNQMLPNLKKQISDWVIDTEVDNIDNKLSMIIKILNSVKNTISKTVIYNVDYNTATLAKISGFNLKCVDYYEDLFLNTYHNRNLIEYKKSKTSLNYNPINWNATQPHITSAPTQDILRYWLWDYYQIRYTLIPLSLSKYKLVIYKNNDVIFGQIINGCLFDVTNKALHYSLMYL